MLSPTKTLFLIRHAHRDNTLRENDNGLSDKGRKQVQRLQKYFNRRFKHEKWAADEIQFESSEKLRCVQTLEPIAALYSKKLTIQPLLIEKRPEESFQKFQNRIQAYKKEWLESSDRVRIICSHGDLLPLLTYQLLGAVVRFKKAGFLELEWEGGQGHLKQVIPSLKAFYD